MKPETSINPDLLKSRRTACLRRLNDLLITTELAADAVSKAGPNLDEDWIAPKRHFIVPGVAGEESLVPRTKKQLHALLDRIATRGLFEQGLTLVVAATEHYLAEVLFLVLRRHPEKLGENKKVDLSLVLEAADLASAQEAAIWRHIHPLFFESPDNYLEQTEKLLSVTLPADLRASYGEMKATRDLCVHNGGFVNHLYIRKAGKRSRGTEGDEIPVDDAYFSAAVGVGKRLTESIYLGLLKKYKV